MHQFGELLAQFADFSFAVLQQPRSLRGPAAGFVVRPVVNAVTDELVQFHQIDFAVGVTSLFIRGTQEPFGHVVSENRSPRGKRGMRDLHRPMGRQDPEIGVLLSLGEQFFEDAGEFVDDHSQPRIGCDRSGVEHQQFQLCRTVAEHVEQPHQLVTLRGLHREVAAKQVGLAAVGNSMGGKIKDQRVFRTAADRLF